MTNGLYQINTGIARKNGTFNISINKKYNEDENTKHENHPRSRKKKSSKTDEFTVRDYIKCIANILRYSSHVEVILMLIGSIFALINGTMTPFMSVVFGDSANVFLSEEKRERMYLCNESLNISDDCITWSDRNEGRMEFMSAIEHYTMRYLIVFIIAITTAFFQIYCWERASDRLVLNIRKAYLSQLLRQDIEWYHNNNTHTNLSARLTDDIERIRDGLGSRVAILLQSVSLLISGQIVAFYKSYKLSLVLLPGLPILATIIAFVASIGSKSSHREQLRYGIAGSIASEALSGIRTVTAYGAQQNVINRYEVALDEGRRLTLSKHYVLATLTGLLNFISFGLYSLGFWYGATLYLSGEMSPGNILTILYCVLQAGLAFGANLISIIDVSTAVALSMNVFAVINRKPPIDCYSEEGIKAELKGNIHLKNISFTYPSRPHIPVIKNIDIKVEEGKILALVGHSGGGKSTIVNLIMRFYDITSGKILLDGLDLSTLNLRSVRSQIGVVSQEPALFDTTIAENIRYGFEGATMEQIEQAAQMANAHNFILQLPKGYDTIVGERGSQLSGGQKQRIAIARALVKQPKILLLDEATSALDSESEAVVQEALDNAIQGRTTIIIAHRLSTIRNAHQICLLKDGLVVERGNHKELMTLKGHYYKMLSIQNKERQSSVGNQLHEVNLNHSYNEQEEIDRDDATKSHQRTSTHLTKCEGDKDNNFLKIFNRKTLPWCLISLTLIGCLVSGLLIPAFAIVYSHVVEMFVLSRDLFKEKLILWNSVLLALALVSCFSYFISLLGSCLSTERMIQTARLDVFASILSQQVSWFDNEEFTTLKLTDSLARDPPQIKAVAGSRFGSLLTGSINLILAVGIAFYSNWKLAGICCLVYPILILVCYRQTSLRYINFAKQDVKIKAASKLASECIENIKTVQMLGLENILYQQYCYAMDSANKSAMMQSLMYSLVYSISSSIIYLIYVVSFKYGAQLLIHNEIDLVHVLRILFEVAFTAPIIGIACNYTQDFVKGKQAVSNLVHIKSFRPAVHDSSAKIKQDIRGDIEFNRVLFCYPTRPDVTILKEFNLVIKAGQRVAIVGTSGCGKSTLISLLERFYNHQAGSILLDGVDIAAWDVFYLRSKMGLVTQEPVLFNGTISDNIKYGCLYEDDCKPTHDEVVKAATMANIHQFILTLPQGYDTLVGNKGCQLSGGQKQRIAIARALIRDPKILLLDEATSALDNHSEKLVQDALDKASKGRTTLVIAHRLSTVQTANFIAVIEDGHVVEIGTHQQLVALQGRYYTMTKSQQMES